MKINKAILVLIVLMIQFQSARANCITVISTSLLSPAAQAAGYTASYWPGTCDTCSGNLGLPSVISLNTGNNFQPPGTLLASSVGSFLSSASSVTYSPNQILYRCSVEDAGSLYEMYATNGDSPFAGMYASDEVEGAYYDVAKNVAVRMTNLSTGQYYSRYWKSRKLTADSWYSDGTYIYIPASAFSNVLYEMFKISSGRHYASAANPYHDLWAQPRGYIALKGPGLITNYLMDGQDSAFYYYGFPGQWPAAWSTYNDVTYVRGALCEVSNYPSVVSLPLITSRDLSSGMKSQTPFSITLRCESGAKSDTSPSRFNSANVAMGFLVKQSTAVSKAMSMGLVTPGGGLTWLLDSSYGSQGTASGVGIKIYDVNGTPLNLLPDFQSTGMGNSRGWYAYKQLTTLSSSSDGLEIYNGDFIASLEALKNQTITAGRVNAQLQVIVSFQ